MLFVPKQNSRYEKSSNSETCISIIGLFLAVGTIGGLSGLIYGLVANKTSGTIVSAIILGVSVFLVIIFVLFVVFCFKNHTTDSNAIQQQQRPHQQPSNLQQQRKPKPQRIPRENSSKEVTIVSTVHPHDHLSDFPAQLFSPYASTSLTDSTNSGYGKQSTQSPSKTSTFIFLNQSHSSADSNHTKQNHSNRY